MNQVQLWAETKLGWRSGDIVWIWSKAKNDESLQLWRMSGPSFRSLLHFFSLQTGVQHCVTKEELETNCSMIRVIHHCIVYFYCRTQEERLRIYPSHSKQGRIGADTSRQNVVSLFSETLKCETRTPSACTISGSVYPERGKASVTYLSLMICMLMNS